MLNDQVTAMRDALVEAREKLEELPDLTVDQVVGIVRPISEVIGGLNSFIETFKTEGGRSAIIELLAKESEDYQKELQAKWKKNGNETER